MVLITAMPRKKAEPKIETLTPTFKDELKDKVRTQTIGYITAAFSLVAGLAWNEAIKSAIDSTFIFSHDSLWVKFIYAALLTLILVLVTIYLNYLFQHEEKK
jgi:hypothetical protein